MREGAQSAVLKILQAVGISTVTGNGSVVRKRDGETLRIAAGLPELSA